MTIPARLPCDAPPPAEHAGPSAGATEASVVGGRWIVAATVMGSGLAFLDATAVNVAVPALQEQMQATSAQVQWVLESYSLVLAGCILAAGALGDRYGRRRVFAAGVCLFAAASLACGLAPAMGALIAARAVQGLGAALLMPGSLAILGSAFQGQARARAIGLWSSLTSVAGVVGPVAGGWIADHLSWRWIFFVNLPLAAAVLLVTLRHVPESRGSGRGRLDLAGAVLATVALAGLVYAALESPRLGVGDARVIAAAGVAVLAGAALVRRERRLERAAVAGRASPVEPMLPLGLFRGRAFAGLNLLTLCLYAAFGAFFWIPFDLVLAHGYSATLAGAALLPMTLAALLLAPRSDAVARRVGTGAVLAAGPALAALGFVLFAVLNADAGYWRGVFPASLVLGVGLGITVAPLTNAVLGSVDAGHVGVASGVNNAVARAAGVLALAALAPLVAHVFDRALDGHLAAMEHAGTALPAAARAALDAGRAKLAAAPTPPGLDAATSAAVRAALRASTDAGFRVAMLVCSALAGLAAVTGWRVRTSLGAAPPPVRRPAA
ncbi:MAG TPA: DHA2 family efflux MFS transporter permease subunit [Longimicrobiaceae bacterium]|jgi:EmrB/QacA subfamily drug resistance transporter|nr:DHA2 family efflux MFS transporter permease subunit [Longimicrobiaceae bacterium]